MTKRASDVIVLDIGGTQIRVGHIREGILSSEFETHDSNSLCVPDAREKLLAIVVTCRDAQRLNLKAVVLGIPGVLDRTQDRISHCNNIPELEGDGLLVFLSNKLGCAVLFEQDIMLQLLGEYRAGAAKNTASVFGVYFGTGIGAAYLINGDPDNPLVQDIQAGHIPIMAEGRLCKCGNTDCIEAYASGHTLTDLALRFNCPIDQLFARKSDVSRYKLLAPELDRFIVYQAYMLASICTMFTPELLVIGGGIPMMSGYPRNALIEKTISHLQTPYPAENIKFTWASLPTEAPLHGALALLDIKHNAIRSTTSVN